MTHINWISYYMQYDGYGRFSSRLAQAMQRLTNVKIATMEHLEMPYWLQKQEGINWDGLTISMLPPYYLQPVPGRHWLFSMTEGSKIPDSWVKQINESGVERVLVPCEHNKLAFETSGVTAPINVVHGGTDALEFPFTSRKRYAGSMYAERPYTFLTLADRGFRKGWHEVWEAFYIAFGGKTTGRQDVRLIIKARPSNTSDTLKFMMNAGDADKRIIYDISTKGDMLELYQTADCLALPSRSEGWGMPHREAAMNGMPVIAQHYSGIDDGNPLEWCLDIPGTIQPIPKEAATQLGEWRVADKVSLALRMEQCAMEPNKLADFGERAARWLSAKQTWMHSAHQLMGLIDG